MTAHKDDGDDAVDVLDVSGVTSAEHDQQRDIAHALCHELEVDAVVLVTLRDGRCITSTMISCTVDDARHVEVGTSLCDGLQTCVAQLDRALVHGQGNGGKGVH